MLWDRGTYELLGDASAEEQLARGDFKFRLHGEKITGEFAIVRMKRGKGNEWLLLKKKDAAAQPGWNTEDHAVSVLTGRTQEEIARGLEKTMQRQEDMRSLPEIGRADAGADRQPASLRADAKWIYEVKWDGVRAICYIQDGQVRMVSRNGNVIDRQYPELSILPHHIKAQTAIVDGEIAALNERGVPSFELLQRRINVADASSVALLAPDTIPWCSLPLICCIWTGAICAGCRSSSAKSC